MPNDEETTGLESAEQPREVAEVEPASAAMPEVPRAGGEGEPGIGGAAAAPEKLLKAEEATRTILARLGVEATVEVRDSSEGIGCAVKLTSGGELFEGPGRAQLLEALTYLVNKIVNRDAEGRKWVTLELGSFPEQVEVAADPEMDALARRLGEAAVRIGKTLTVVPMHARDRKRVHVALSAQPGVKTRSEGEGLFRRLLVEPK